ncbi:MAG: type II toxin-antitoxin system HicB family antitoxin [Tannerella sp.]|jgi:predicted HicB family RNase H-like nuclease|nr:type II toxin-antitoxin system HicB family antitoxin [Tannerella sp.]
MSILEYKGYTGSIEFSKEDKCLYGRVLGMPDNLISYEGNTADELYDDFKASIETYLDFCKRQGIKPQKSYTGNLNIRIPADIHYRIAMLASRNGTTINALVRDSLEKSLQLPY